jgi:hypothetical protein
MREDKDGQIIGHFRQNMFTIPTCSMTVDSATRFYQLISTRRGEQKHIKKTLGRCLAK